MIMQNLPTNIIAVVQILPANIMTVVQFSSVFKLYVIF